MNVRADHDSPSAANQRSAADVSAHVDDDSASAADRLPGGHEPADATHTGGARHAAGVEPAIRSKALVRLKRIEGQVRGIHRMVDEERYCADILTQISSVQEALRAVGKLLMRNHLEHCVTDALRSGDRLEAERAYQEVLDLMYRHAR